MRTIYLLILVAAVSSACQVDQVPVDGERAAVIPFATSVSGTVMPLQPILRQLCPDNSEVALDQLRLSTDEELLVQPPPATWEWDDDGLGLYSIGRGSLVPMPVDSLSLVGEVNGLTIQESPNRQWLLIPRKSVTNEFVSQWMSSSDGRQQWKLTSDRSAEIGAWVDDHTVLLGSFVDDSHNPYYFEFLRMVDPFTGEGRDIDNLPGIYAPGRGWLVFRHLDQEYLLYQSADGYGLRDLRSERDWPVLGWLSALNLKPHERGIEVRPDGRVVIRVARPDGVEVSLPVNPLDMIGMEYEDFAMGSISLPPSVHAALWGIRRVIVNGEQLYGEGGSFLWYDYLTGELRDYCIEYHNSALVSGDGQFAAVMIYYLPGPPPIHSTVWLLDLSTGQRARLEDVYPVAWVQEKLERSR